MLQDFFLALRSKDASFMSYVSQYSLMKAPNNM